MPVTRRPLIAGNWKMNLLSKDAELFMPQLTVKILDMAQRRGDTHLTTPEVLICPQLPLLEALREGRHAIHRVKLGAQDCHSAVSGAHTGDTSAELLKDVGCEYVIVGHSERRADHGETSGDVHAKAEAAQAAGLVPIVCVGETEAQRDAGGAIDVVSAQIMESVPVASTAETLVIAYEPVWAIGTGRTPTPDEVQEVHAAARSALAKRCNGQVADGTRLLYGGSVKPSNAQELLALEDVDGALVGGASLKVEDFAGIIEAA